MHLSIDRTCRQEAAAGLLESSYRIDDLSRFLDIFYQVTDTLNNDTPAASRCGVLLAKRYYMAGDYRGVLGALHQYVSSGTTAIRDERCLLASLSSLSLRKYEQAMSIADSIASTSPFRPFTDSLKTARMSFMRQERSPMLAGVLSTAIPGLGYLYVNRPQTAVATLLINGLFIWSTYDFFHSRHYGAGTTALLLGSGFYFGSINGSIRAAIAFNDNAHKKKISILFQHVPYTW